ncbi:hypothetical protein LCGC14_0363580 [marine sediment metagenome]|uniref:Uncharacterized protein n=1 Tax=marine sediment metagenome TaxID=412755 RepID=A0A0F9VUK5_9ZZZZ
MKVLLLRVLLYFVVIAGIAVGVYKAVKYFAGSRARVGKAHVEKFHDDEEKRADKKIKAIKKSFKPREGK